MSRFVFIIFIGLSLTCFSEELNPVKEKLSNGVNKIIARVNDAVITLRDLQEFSRSAAIDKSNSITGKQALENLIEEKLIVQLAKKEKFKVDEQWVDKKIKHLVSAYGGYNKLDKSLAKAGLNIAAIKKKIGNNFLIHQAVDKYVGSQINVSPMEVTEYYKKNIKEFITLAKYICWITKSSKKSFLEELSMKIKEEGFDKVLTEQRDIFFKVESNENGLKDEVKKVVKSIKEGQWEIKEIEGTYYLIYLVNVVPAHTAFLNDVRDKIYKKLWRDKFSNKFETWVSGLKEKSVIKIYPVRD